MINLRMIAITMIAVKTCKIVFWHGCESKNKTKRHFCLLVYCNCSVGCQTTGK